MSGLSTLINAGAGAIDGYRDQQYTQNAQDALQEQRANQALKDAAAQQTYQPQAQAAVAQAGLSQAQNTAQTGLVPQQAALASTNLDTQQSAASTALQNQPLANQTATNQATTQAALTGAQATNAPQQAGDMQLQQAQADQQAHVTALTGLYSSMREGPQAAQQYVQKVADSGTYPNMQGKQIGQVGLTADGQNFVAQDSDGNQVFTLPVSALQQAYKMSIPTKFESVPMGGTLVGTQGGQVTSQTTAPVPDAMANKYVAPEVQMTKYLQSGNSKMTNAQAFAMVNQAKTLSREAFVQQGLPNMLTIGGAKDANDATQKLLTAWDQMHPTPGLSQMPGSNTSGNPNIDSLIGTTPNPFNTGQ
jgi:hypothetical protein